MRPAIASYTLVTAGAAAAAASYPPICSSNRRCSMTASVTAVGGRAEPALLKWTTLVHPGVSSRARVTSSVGGACVSPSERSACWACALTARPSLSEVILCSSGVSCVGTFGTMVNGLTRWVVGSRCRSLAGDGRQDVELGGTAGGQQAGGEAGQDGERADRQQLPRGYAHDQWQVGAESAQRGCGQTESDADSDDDGHGGDEYGLGADH